MFISSHFSLNCIFGKMQPGVEDQLIKLLIETQKHDPVKMFPFDIQTNVRKGVCSNIAPWFRESPILEGRIHGAKLPESGLGHNFCTLAT